MAERLGQAGATISSGASMMGNLIKAAAAAMLLNLAPASHATSVTYAFSGQRLNSSIAGTASTFSGTLTYNPAVPPYYTTPSGDGSIYFSLSSYTFTSGALTVSAFAKPAPVGDPDRHAFIEIINSYTDSFDANLDNSNSTITPGITSVRFNLRNTQGSAFDSTALPVFLDLNDYQQKLATIIKDGTTFNGEITSLRLVSLVPEPASWAMTIFGFGLIGTTIRRRRGIAASLL